MSDKCEVESHKQAIYPIIKTQLSLENQSSYCRCLAFSPIVIKIVRKFWKNKTINTSETCTTCSHNLSNHVNGAQCTVKVPAISRCGCQSVVSFKQNDVTVPVDCERCGHLSVHLKGLGCMITAGNKSVNKSELNSTDNFLKVTE